MIGFYNPDEKCLRRGTDCGFKYSGLRLVRKGLSDIYILRFADCLSTKQRTVAVNSAQCCCPAQLLTLTTVNCDP